MALTLTQNWVLGLDPGLTTGVSIYDVRGDSCHGFQADDENLGTQLETLIDSLRPSVACEAFVITIQTARNSAAPWSLEKIGVARFLCQKYGVPFAIQGQSSAKKFATDARLKALGWYQRGQPHQNDAHRQTLLHLVNSGWWHPTLTKENDS